MEISESTYLIIKLSAENCGISREYDKPRRISMHTEKPDSILMSQEKTLLYQYYACLRDKEMPISILIISRKKIDAIMFDYFQEVLSGLNTVLLTTIMIKD